jgi:hypothetical protein
MEFVKFLRRSLSTISIDLMGISLIVLKRPYIGRKIRLYPFYPKDAHGVPSEK